MPGFGKTLQAVVPTRGLEDSSHAFMMTILTCLCKTITTASSAGRAIPRDPKHVFRLVA
jgi:hypothetical protein